MPSKEKLKENVLKSSKAQSLMSRAMSKITEGAKTCGRGVERTRIWGAFAGAPHTECGVTAASEGGGGRRGRGASPIPRCVYFPET